MKVIIASLLALVASTSAFAPAYNKASATTTALQAVDLKSFPGATAPMGAFDPLDLANLGSEETFNWMRAAELKHSRVSMLAATGFMLNCAGVHFPGYLSSDVSFESLSAMRPVDAWAAVPEAGKWQIVLSLGIAEIIGEIQPLHYVKGGPLPTMIFPPVDFSNVDPAVLKSKQSKELNNGRLAMIGIMSFISASNIPGSVPFLDGNPNF